MNFSGYQAQAVLFAARPSRLALQQLKLDGSGLRAVRINVWRNHAIEPVIALALPYLAYARCLADFHLSDYDDTLMFSGRQPADIELLWLDSSRYLDHSRFDDWLDWLIGRMKVLRTANPAPIIVATLKRELAASVLVRNHSKTTMNWRFMSIDPRSALKHLYPSISLGYLLVMGK